ncbi:MAG: hypothetical protein WC812_03420 [Candidatus Pacearchaeota archaeon]|jgi:hypothetical protein
MKKKYLNIILVIITFIALVITTSFQIIGNNRAQTEFEIRTRPYLVMDSLTKTDTYTYELIIENKGETLAKINYLKITAIKISNNSQKYEGYKSMNYISSNSKVIQIINIFPANQQQMTGDYEVTLICEYSYPTENNQDKKFQTNITFIHYENKELGIPEIKMT